MVEHQIANLVVASSILARPFFFSFRLGRPPLCARDIIFALLDAYSIVKPNYGSKHENQKETPGGCFYSHTTTHDFPPLSRGIPRHTRNQAPDCSVPPKALVDISPASAREAFTTHSLCLTGRGEREPHGGPKDPARGACLFRSLSLYISYYYSHDPLSVVVQHQIKVCHILFSLF